MHEHNHALDPTWRNTLGGQALPWKPKLKSVQATSFCHLVGASRDPAAKQGNPGVGAHTILVNSRLSMATMTVIEILPMVFLPPATS